MSSRFDTTRWSMVLAAARPDSPARREALADLCQAYWYPLYAYIRRQGYAAEEARDLNQSYFALLLEKNYLRDVQPQAGRFRSFLLASIRHFLANERDRVRALKRAAERFALPLDREASEHRYRSEARDDLTPEQLYERHWARTLLARSLDRLEQELAASGKTDQFERLKGLLTSAGPQPRYKELAQQLQISESALKVTVHRLRRRFGVLLHDEVEQTVARPADVDGELRHLLPAVNR